MNSTATPHIGRKISRIRGMKQETLAEELGISQQSVSQMEQSESLEDEKLDKVAKALGVSKEAIKNFSEEAILNFIGKTYHVDNSSAVNYGCTFNPIDKIIEQSDKIEELYKKLLEAEKEKVAYLERLLDKK